MTVKEAIDELKYSRDMCYFDPSTGETGEPYDEDCERKAQALDIAIEALESETDGDCISRQALKQAMYSAAFELDSDMQKWDGGCWIRYRLFEKIIDIIPSVHPEQKTFRWIDAREQCGEFMCSNCQFLCCTNQYNYCPDCGAKMEQEG